MKVRLQRSIENRQSIEVELTDFPVKNNLKLHLPAWRPGRYELQNFAKNVIKLEAFCAENKVVKSSKLTKDSWLISSPTTVEMVKITYYTNQKDAGGSYVDDLTFYINFVNCIPYIQGFENELYSLQLVVPESFSYTCSLNMAQRVGENIFLNAGSIYELYDSPFIAAAAHDWRTYSIDNTHFFIHFFGNYNPNWNRLLPNFERFTRFQVSKMGDFPEPKYDFIFWILPDAFYHGVEHHKNTMMVMGPNTEEDALIIDMLGLASHELFHAWNICKIRPVELLPYDYSKPSFFESGFIIEGVTTYLGDLFLYEAGVFDQTQYLKELSSTCQRHFLKSDTTGQSIMEASIDLWIDGYSAGVPGKRGSIYYKGAILAMMLDLMIRQKTNGTKTIYEVMQQMWLQFGKKNIGYHWTDYQSIAENIYGESLSEYFEKYIMSTEPLLPYFQELIEKLGLKLVFKDDSCVIEGELKTLVV